MQKLIPSLFKDKNFSSFQCEICQLAKNHCSNFLSCPYKESKPFTLIHSDSWGPSKVANSSSTKLFVTFIDDHIGVCWVFLLKEKSDAEKTFNHFHMWSKINSKQAYKYWELIMVKNTSIPFLVPTC